MISSEYIDDIYSGALENGASGGKLLGAGGGVSFCFMCRRLRNMFLMNYLKSRNLLIQPFRFEPDGLKAWKSRQSVHSVVDGKLR